MKKGKQIPIVDYNEKVIIKKLKFIINEHFYWYLI